MARIDAVYQYYLSTYGHENASRYDSHKKSELRYTYNSIVKSNKESPLYKIKNTGDEKKFAIDIKENARKIKNVISSLTEDDGISSAFHKKVAVSDHEDDVSVSYIGNSDDTDRTDHFQIEVKQLASAQTNVGNYLKDDGHALKPGSYSFDLTAASNSYEFQFTVNEEDTNRDVLNKLSKLIGNAGIGLRAEVIDGQKEDSALAVSSRKTGLGENEHFLFNIMPQSTTSSMEAMDVLGINRITSPAQNSKFLLNGTERSSLSNTITINNTFELSFHKPSENGAANVGFKTNAEAVADNISDLVTAYNNIIATANNYDGTSQNSKRLLSDMGHIAEEYREDFSKIGLSVGDDSIITVDKDRLREAVDAEDAEESFSVLNRFKNSLSVKADQASVDPMKYVDKVVVAYKNPGHNFATPYISSVYSGMIVDQRL